MTKTIGISIKNINVNLFSNGATQHVYTMAKLFQTLGWKVYLISNYPPDPKKHNNYMNLPIITYAQLLKMLKLYEEGNIIPSIKLDLFLCFEWYAKSDWFSKMKDMFKCKIVKYQCGNLYETVEDKYLQCENFGELNNFNESYSNVLDATWVSPHYESRIPIYNIMYNTPSYVFPYLWEPNILLDSLSKKPVPDYNTTLTNNHQQFCVGICEPNRDILKCTYIPFIASIKAIKDNIIHKVHIFNNKNIKQSVQNVLKIMQCPGKYVSYNTRITIVDVLNKCSAVICHQRDHMLNYIYLEVPLLGFPLLHNSPMCKDIGYYYETLDDIPKLLNTIKQCYDPIKYQIRNVNEIMKYGISNPENLIKIKQLMSQTVG